MVLSRRFSNAPCFNGTLRSHRGEPIFRQARKLLKEDFDHLSITVIQAYILQSTYWLTFGGGRKAWVYLGKSNSWTKNLLGLLTVYK